MIHKQHHVSLAAYDRLVQQGYFNNIKNRIEFIRGEIVERNPAGPMHDDIVTYLTDWSTDHRDKTKTLITSQTGLDLHTIDSRPEPDIFWVRRARYRTRHPQANDVQLAIEVADSSLDKDLEIKRAMYAQVGIIEYWIVDIQSECVHVLRDPVNGDYQSHAIVKAPQRLSPIIAPNAMLDLKDMFTGE